MGQRPTILDVAKKAGVSKSTVSLVLQQSASVKESTRVAVRQAMADIGYVYNRSAATLRSSSSGLIGLVINDLRNPFFAEFATSFQMELAQNGFATVLANTDEDPLLQSRTISSLIEHGVSGFVISPAYGQEEDTLAVIEAAGVPTLQVFRALSQDDDRFPFVAPDYKLGGTCATEHLLEMGCKRIAFLGGLNGRAVTQERMSGYLDVLARHRQEPVILTGEVTRRFGKQMVAKLAADHPDVDGVICFNDLVGLGVLSACVESGIQVGRDLRVVGFDDIQDCQDSFPALSSVSCHIPDFAKTTAAQILSWINDGVRPNDHQRSEVELAIRASSGQP
ncbi:LacI family DNA-binding transcriptional regulator [Yoonia sp. F2084L]|uniref:LacI family DNA-binding transcriptional regulator n=1 Tax=Yoonia sp. F2084L TaxID=2926419 RepID=UPI001FF37EBE|nr:LacI family DNA-binding transcriptional regulator [Yoonia sp. F2084L]MCK0094849.1 LacI family DNA-binding transcriptional regulator [Yoonia sp. F2084L]